MRKPFFATILALTTLLALSPSFAAGKTDPASKRAPAQVEQKAEAQAAPKAQVNINKASAEEISDVLVGVGPAKAEAIIAYREQQGGFKTIEELAEVKGIGEATLAKNKERILLK